MLMVPIKRFYAGLLEMPLPDETHELQYSLNSNKGQPAAHDAQSDI